MSVKESMDMLNELGLPAAEIAAEMKALVKAQTVTTGEGGKKLDRAIPPSPDVVRAMAAKVAGPHIAKAESYIVDQVASLA